MIFKLVMGGQDWINRPVRVGRITRWLKGEGDLVEYGDDLCDFEVEGVLAPSGLWEVRRQRVEYRGPMDIAELASRQLEGEPLPLAQIDPDELHPVGLAPAYRFIMRVTSAQRAVLRRIDAGEGESREAGEILGVLSTSDEEPIGDDGAAARDAPALRVVQSCVWRAGPDEQQFVPTDPPR